MNSTTDAEHAAWSREQFRTIYSQMIAARMVKYRDDVERAEALADAVQAALMATLEVLIDDH